MTLSLRYQTDQAYRVLVDAVARTAALHALTPADIAAAAQEAAAGIEAMREVQALDLTERLKARRLVVATDGVAAAADRVA